jgi:hypothetical protein
VAGMDKEKAAILEAIHQWEKARQGGAFPESVKPGLQDVNREFHLVPAEPGEWELQSVNPTGPAVRIKAKTNIATGTKGLGPSEPRYTNTHPGTKDRVGQSRFG